MHQSVPRMPHPLVEAFGRPTWRERRRKTEALQLATMRPELTLGQGRPVVLVPGFGGTPDSIGELRRWLSDADYSVDVADVERNTTSSAFAAGRIAEALERTDQPAILIGHSRGGQQSRVAAQRHPERVRQLITLGSPIRAHVPKHFALRVAVESLRVASNIGVWHSYDADAESAYEATLLSPFEAAVPWSSIWSKSDGFVVWQAAFDPAATNIEVECSHRGLIESVPSFAAIAGVLSGVSGG